MGFLKLIANITAIIKANFSFCVKKLTTLIGEISSMFYDKMFDYILYPLLTTYIETSSRLDWKRIFFS